MHFVLGLEMGLVKFAYKIYKFNWIKKCKAYVHIVGGPTMHMSNDYHVTNRQMSPRFEDENPL